MRKLLTKYWLPLSTGAIATTICLQFQGTIRGYEAKVSDLYQEIGGTTRPPGELVIVAIDDFSLQQAANSDLSKNIDLRRLREWPWPREYYSQVIERTIRAGAHVVGFDLLFDTPSVHGRRDDETFAQTIRKHADKVVLASHILESNGAVAGLSLRKPTETIYKEAKPENIGLINAMADIDGNVRRRPSEYARRLEAIAKGDNANGFSDSVLKSYLRHGQKGIAETTTKHQVGLRFYGPPRTVKTIPIWQVLEPNSFREIKGSGLFEKAIVLVGPTALAMQDLHRTAFSGSEGMPGVEIHATEIGNRLEGKSIRSAALDDYQAAAFGIMIAVLGITYRYLERPITRLAWTVCLSSLLACASFILVTRTGWGIELSTASALILFGGVANTIEATARLQLNRYRLRRSLERYLSPAVASEVIRLDEQKQELLQGKNAEVAILLTDIRGFTTYTKEMTTQGRTQEAVARLNRYFERVVEIAHNHGGMVDKFIGDSALIVFGAPLSRGSQTEARAAIDCAEELCCGLIELNRHWVDQGLEPWDQVIALSFGKVVCGNVGSERRMDYTVIGDAVNAASRLESIAKQRNRSIIVSSEYAEILVNEKRLVFDGLAEIRGQGEVEIYRLEAK